MEYQLFFFINYHGEVTVYFDQLNILRNKNYDIFFQISIKKDFFSNRRRYRDEWYYNDG